MAGSGAGKDTTDTYLSAASTCGAESVDRQLVQANEKRTETSRDRHRGRGGAAVRRGVATRLAKVAFDLGLFDLSRAQERLAGLVGELKAATPEIRIVCVQIRVQGGGRARIGRESCA